MRMPRNASTGLGSGAIMGASKAAPPAGLRRGEHAEDARERGRDVVDTDGLRVATGLHAAAEPEERHVRVVVVAASQ